MIESSIEHGDPLPINFKSLKKVDRQEPKIPIAVTL